MSAISILEIELGALLIAHLDDGRLSAFSPTFLAWIESLLKEPI
jgi:hypothetical protein